MTDPTIPCTSDCIIDADTGSNNDSTNNLLISSTLPFDYYYYYYYDGDFDFSNNALDRVLKPRNVVTTILAVVGIGKLVFTISNI